jgi:hypothetical protein
VDEGGDWLIRGDVDGAQNFDFEILFVGLATLM